MKENILMIRTKWRILAVISALLLAMGLAAAPALADDYEITPDLRVGSWMLQLDDTPTIPGVTYDKASNTVTLTNVEITTDNTMVGAIYYADYSSSSRELTVKLVGSNKIHLHHHADSAFAVGRYGAKPYVKITGGGSLVVDGGRGALLFNRGSLGSITIDGVNMSTDTAGFALMSAGLTIKNSTITINSKISGADGFYGLDYASRLSIQNSRLEIKNTSGTADLYHTHGSTTMQGVKAYTGNGKAEYSLAEDVLHSYDFSGTYLLLTNEDLGLPTCTVGSPDITFTPASLKYNGTSQRPKVSVKVKGQAVAASNYTVKWNDGGKSAGAVGTHTATVTLKGAYIGEESADYKVVKGVNPLVAKAKVKTKTFKYAKVKAKTQSVKLSKLISVSKAAGKVTYKKKSGNKKIVVKSGKLYVKKGLKKGTYTVKVAVTAAGNGNYDKGTKVVSFKVKVK